MRVAETKRKYETQWARRVHFSRHTENKRTVTHARAKHTIICDDIKSVAVEMQIEHLHVYATYDDCFELIKWQTHLMTRLGGQTLSTREIFSGEYSQSFRLAGDQTIRRHVWHMTQRAWSSVLGGGRNFVGYVFLVYAGGGLFLTRCFFKYNAIFT